MSEHPQLNTGKFTNEFTFKKAKELWMDLAKLLNAMPGCNKEWDKWRKTWHDLKNSTKAKAAANRRNENRTVGGVSPIYVLDHEENQVLDLLNPVQIEGLPALEPITEFNFDKMEVVVQPSENIQVKGKEGDYRDSPNNKENVKASVEIQEWKKQSVKKKIENRVQRLTHTINATETINAQMAEKLIEKKAYHNKKLALMEQNIAAKNRIADALEAMVAALRSGSSSRF